MKHISTAVWAPPGFLQWHEVALQLPKCTQCTAQHQEQAQQCVQGTYCGGWRRCACLDAKTRVLAVGALVSTTYNNLTADLLLTRRVPCHQPGAGLAGWAKNLGVLVLLRGNKCAILGTSVFAKHAVARCSFTPRRPDRVCK